MQTLSLQMSLWTWSFSPPAFCLSALSYLIFCQYGIPPWCFFLTRDKFDLQRGNGLNNIYNFTTETVKRDWEKLFRMYKCSLVLPSLGLSTWILKLPTITRQLQSLHSSFAKSSESLGAWQWLLILLEDWTEAQNIQKGQTLHITVCTDRHYKIKWLLYSKYSSVKWCQFGGADSIGAATLLFSFNQVSVQKHKTNNRIIN